VVEVVLVDQLLLFPVMHQVVQVVVELDVVHQIKMLVQEILPQQVQLKETLVELEEINKVVEVVVLLLLVEMLTLVVQVMQVMVETEFQ
tara:strand:+ start:283 stop:549 length:267 start_codon:yes stop_codon:yes gene_type:complete